jgi:hypothetical protein
VRESEGAPYYLAGVSSKPIVFTTDITAIVEITLETEDIAKV